MCSTIMTYLNLTTTHARTHAHTHALTHALTLAQPSVLGVGVSQQRRSHVYFAVHGAEHARPHGLPYQKICTKSARCEESGWNTRKDSRIP